MKRKFSNLFVCFKRMVSAPPKNRWFYKIFRTLYEHRSNIFWVLASVLVFMFLVHCVENLVAPWDALFSFVKKIIP